MCNLYTPVEKACKVLEMTQKPMLEPFRFLKSKDKSPKLCFLIFETFWLVLVTVTIDCLRPVNKTCKILAKIMIATLQAFEISQSKDKSTKLCYLIRLSGFLRLFRGICYSKSTCAVFADMTVGSVWLVKKAAS